MNVQAHPTRRRRMISISTAYLTLCGLTYLMGASSAFCLPHDPLVISRSKIVSASTLSKSTFIQMKQRRRLRRYPRFKLKRLLVSTMPDQLPPSASIESDETSNNVIMSLPLNLPSTNETNPFFLSPVDKKYELMESEADMLDVEIHEIHAELHKLNGDVNHFPHIMADVNKNIETFVSPFIPVSYDAQGMVQADSISSSQGGVFHQISDTSSTSQPLSKINQTEEYPQFIKFLFQKDTNGQTVASKLFNLTLLAMSFGYVFFSVFNIDKGMTRGWTAGEIGMRIPLDTWASYENSLSEKPVATKTIINIVIYLLGDWLSQTMFQKKNVLDFDAGRTIKNGFIGMCFGPAVHEYYEFSDWILPVEGTTLGLTNRAFKILMDQTIYLASKCSIYIIAVGLLNGESVENASENVKNRLKPIMFTAWKFWPLVHCVTYGLIPARHRILWVNSVDLIWNAILASKARDDGAEDEKSIDDLEKDNNDLTLGTNKINDLDLSFDIKHVEFDIDQKSTVVISPTVSVNDELLEEQWDTSDTVASESSSIETPYL